MFIVFSFATPQPVRRVSSKSPAKRGNAKPAPADSQFEPFL